MPVLPIPLPSIEIVAASQGMSKGLRQTSGLQLIVHPEVAIGPLFVGGYYKNVTSTTTEGEAAFLVGLRHRVAGFDLSASADYKWDPGSPAGVDGDAFEFNLTASRRFGPIVPHVSLTYSPDDLGATRRSLFTEAGAAVDLFAGFSVSAAAGRRARDGGPDYSAFNAGASYTIAHHLTLDVRYYGTDNGRLGDIYRNRLVASLRAHI